MNSVQTEFLYFASKRYIWWKSPESALKYPQRILAQIMNLGSWDDVRKMYELFSKDELRKVLLEAEAGQFSEKSWCYWNYILANCPINSVPNPPERVL